MPENWKTYKLKDLTSVITKGTTPSTYGFDFEECGINYIRAQSLSYEGKIDDSVFSFISEEAHNKLKRSQLQPGDILFSMAGAYLGMTGMVKESFCPANTNQAVGIIRINNSSVSPKFVEFLLRNPSTVSFVNAQSGQSAQPNINLAEIGNLAFEIPQLQEQKSIASILSALDDKIELNLQMNKTLEEMAMALYKHWFVDFGPFQEGEFVDSELGEIPKGWEVKPINSIVNIFKKSFKPQDNPDLDFLHYSIPAFDKGKMPVEEKGLEMKSNKTLLNSNRILVSKLNPRFPRIWTVFYRESEEIGVTSPEFINYEVKKSDDWSYANFLFRENGFYSKFHENATGSTGSRQRVQPSLTLQFSCPIPPADIRRDFNQLVNPMLKQIDENLVENQNLSQLRDTLLPKLISGEVRVKDVEKTLSEVL